MQVKLGILLLIVLGSLSLTLKLFGIQTMPGSQRREIDVLTQYLHTRDLIPIETFDLNREGSFTAHIYRHKNCNGGWLISAMQRNSEAVSLFARQAIYKNYPMGQVFYLLNGETYEEFPELGLWLSQKIHAVKYMARISNTTAQPVFAVRSFGECKKEVFL